jgi:LysW-gamma-L-lysine carboxypeptidase
MKLQDYTVELLRHMVEISSTSGCEQKLASFLAQEMKKLGYKVTIDQVGNVLGESGLGSPRILLCGHMDTVPGELPVFLENGVLHGRGSVDAKSSLAAMIVAGKMLIDEGFKGSLIVVGCVEEEGSNRGIRAIIDADLGVDYAVFGEPTNADTITIGYKGMLLLSIAVKTSTGHSSAPWLHVNAIEAAMKIHSMIRNTVRKMSTSDQGFEALTLNLREITGGRNYGMIPEDCHMWVEFRVPPNIQIDALKEEIQHTVNTYLRYNQSVKVKITEKDRVDPYVADIRGKLVRAFTSSIYKLTGRRVTLVKRGGTGDMNFFGAAVKIPVITYGPGDPHLDHTEIERIKISEYMKSIEALKLALNSLMNSNIAQ